MATIAVAAHSVLVKKRVAEEELKKELPAKTVKFEPLDSLSSSSSSSTASSVKTTTLCQCSPLKYTPSFTKNNTPVASYMRSRNRSGKEDALQFMLTSIVSNDPSLASMMNDSHPRRLNNSPTLDVYGVLDETGESIVVHVHGFQPYFWIQVPEQEKGHVHDYIHRFTTALNVQIAHEFVQLMDRIAIQYGNSKRDTHEEDNEEPEEPEEESSLLPLAEDEDGQVTIHPSSRRKTKNKSATKKPMTHVFVDHVTVCDKSQSCFGFPSQKDALFLKVPFTSSRALTMAKQILKNGLVLAEHSGSDGNDDHEDGDGDGTAIKQKYTTHFFPILYETNVPHEIRFMMDRQMRGSCWLRLEKHDYYLHASTEMEFTNRSQVEVCCSFEALQTLPITALSLAKISPMRVMSMHLEYGSSDLSDDPPVAEQDPIMVIAACIVGSDSLLLDNVASLSSSETKTKTMSQHVFALDKSADIPGSSSSGVTVRRFQTESALLAAFVKFLQDASPDILTGYNCNNNTLSYLYDRIRHVFPGRLAMLDWSRSKGFPVKKRVHSENAQIHIEFVIPGCTVVDILTCLKRQQQQQQSAQEALLRSTNFEHVCEHLLGITKETLDSTHTAALQFGKNSSPTTRRRLNIYCLKQALLVLKLIEKRNMIHEWMMQTRVNGLTMEMNMTRDTLPFETMFTMIQHFNQHHLRVPIMDKFTLSSLNGSKEKNVETKDDDDHDGRTESKRVIEEDEEGKNGTSKHYRNASSSELSLVGKCSREIKPGYYDMHNPVLVMRVDSSSYSSILAKANLCYSTYLPGCTWSMAPDERDAYLREHCGGRPLTREDIMPQMAGSDHMFVKPHIRTSILGCTCCWRATTSQLTSVTSRMDEEPTRHMLRCIDNVVKDMVHWTLTSETLPLLAISQTVQAIVRSCMSTLVTKNPTLDILCHDEAKSHIMVLMRGQSMDEAHRTGFDFCTRFGMEHVEEQHGMCMVRETVYAPFLLCESNKYAGRRCDDPMTASASITPHFTINGLVTVRRTVPLFVSETVRDAVIALLDVVAEPSLSAVSSSSVRTYAKPAMAIVHRAIQQLYTNEVDMSRLVCSTQLSKAHDEYSTRHRTATSVVATKLHQRHASFTTMAATAITTTTTTTRIPRMNDRVLYVYVQQDNVHGKSKSALKIVDGAEDPLYALAHGLPLDVDQYIKRLHKPLMCIFQPLLGDDTMKLLFQGEHTMKRHACFTPLKQEQLVKTAQQLLLTVSDDMKKDDQHHLLVDAAKQFLSIATPSSSDRSSLTSIFTPVAVTCIVCCTNRLNRRNPVEQKSSICHTCRLDIERHRNAANTSVQTCITHYNQIWAVCEQCRGRAETEDMCVNSECGIFFKRHAATRQLLVAHGKRLSLSW